MDQRTADDENRRRSGPENEAPVQIAVNGEVISDGENALYLSSCEVFSTGMFLRVKTLTRVSKVEQRPFRQVLLGVEFSDGSRASSFGGRLDPGTADNRPQVWQSGGSGGQRRYDHTFFVSPLPPPGPVRVYYAFPAAGLPDGSTELSGDEILACAARVRELWPWEPEMRQAGFAATPKVSADSWFAQDQPSDPPKHGRMTRTASASSTSSTGWGIAKRVEEP